VAGSVDRLLAHVRFETDDTMNPSKDILTVCIDRSGEVMGWSYGRGQIGHEAEFTLAK
jgi:hypothetical protein